MKSFKQFLEEQDESCRIDEGMLDKLFQKAMEKLALLIGEERMKKLANLVAKWKSQNIDKAALKREFEGMFKTFKLEPAVSKEIQTECAVNEDGEPLNEHLADMIIAANYGFWTAVMVKAVLGLGIPVVLGIIKMAIQSAAKARRKKNPYARMIYSLDQMKRDLK